MSLINRMLQDLEQRRAGNEVSAVMSASLRVTPARRRALSLWWIMLPVTVAGGAALAWHLGKQGGVIQPFQPVIISVPAVPVAPLPASESDIKPEFISTASIAGGEATALTAPGTETITATAASSLSADFSRGAGSQSNAGNPITYAESPVKATRVPARQSGPAASNADSDASQGMLEAENRASQGPKHSVPITESAVPAAGRGLKQDSAQTPKQVAENAYQRATVLIQQSRTDEAIVALQQSLNADAHHVDAVLLLASLLLQERRIDQAVQMLQQGLAANPEQPRLATLLARLQIERGELRAALGTLHATLPFAKGQAEYHQFLAALLQRDNRHAEAITHYRLALQSVPQHGLWRMGLGISLQASGQPAEAREALQQARADSRLTPELRAFIDRKLEELR